MRPVIHKQMVREHLTIYGAVEPRTGDFFYMIEPKFVPKKSRRRRRKRGAHKKKIKNKPDGWKSRQMNEFMQRLANAYPDDIIVLVCDKAWWHNSQYNVTPDSVRKILLPPCSPEMNPIEQLWRELRTSGFHNKYFNTLDAVENNLHHTIANTTSDKIRSITQRDWFMKNN